MGARGALLRIAPVTEPGLVWTLRGSGGGTADPRRVQRTGFLLIAIFALLLALPGDSLIYRGMSGELAVRPPRIEEPDIRVDARLDEPEWRRAAILTGFSQYEPVEGIPSTEATEVLVFYAPDAIYFGIRALDSRPDLVRARLGERDQAVFGDDWVRLTLDTYNDRRQAYLFYVNPLGIQVDGYWIEGLQRRRGGPPLPVDFNPDFIWQSDGRVTEDGWVAEIRIPYVSLRFPEAASQSWGINVAREVRRHGFKQSWAPLTANRSNTLEQSGALVDLVGLEPQRLVEFTPVVTGKRDGRLTADGRFERGDFEPQAGLDFRYGVTQNLVLDATVNPDFSQVESDADQLTVNERFALFFPEKRPFFLDGAEIFNTPRRLVHTRSIVDPIGGAKLTGKLGPLSLGYLGALDESPITFGEAEEEALFNLVRLRGDLGSGGSTIGGLYTDRTLLGGAGFNRVAALDGRVLFGGRYTLTGLLAGSWTRGALGPDGEDVLATDGPEVDDATVAGPTAFSPLVSLQLARSGRGFGFDLEFEDTRPDFRARAGFIPRVGDTRLFGRARFTLFGAPGARLQSWGPELRVETFFPHDDFWGGRGPAEAEVEFQTRFNLRGNTELNALMRLGYFDFQQEDYAGYQIRSRDGSLSPFTVPPPLEAMWAVAVIGNSTLSEWLQLRGRIYYRQIPVFAEAGLGRELQIAPTIELRPNAGLRTEFSYTLSRLWRERDDSRFSTAHIARARLQYQFSKALFARVIGQYDLEDRSALRDPVTERPLYFQNEPLERIEDGDFRFELLLAFEPSPGTVVFAGWSRLLHGPDTFSLDELETVGEGIFMKVSYLLRI